MATFDPHPQRRPAVVSGASSGIGEAVARALGAAGHPVVLGARRLERCQQVASEIVAGGGEAVGLFLDVADPGSVKDFVAAAERAVGPIEVVVSNAGQCWPGTAAEAGPEAFARELEVNLVGAQRLLTLLVPPMVERRRGDVVLVTSDSVRFPRPGMAAYTASKWGLEGLARVMQMELEGTGVRVSVVRPGPAQTEMGSGWESSVVEGLLRRWKRWGVQRHHHYLAPDAIARVVLAVVSMPRGAHVTEVEVQPEAPVRAPGPSEEGSRG